MPPSILSIEYFYLLLQILLIQSFGMIFGRNEQKSLLAVLPLVPSTDCCYLGNYPGSQMGHCRIFLQNVNKLILIPLCVKAENLLSVLLSIHP